MKALLKRINGIDKDTKATIQQRLNEFRAFKDKKSNEEWFSELCFCILTANSRAKTALAIQNELGFKGFSKLSQNKIRDTIKRNKHRFHNNKSKYILEARKNINIKEKIESFSDEKEAREWLVQNIKGLGYKEASHFLRNTGHFNLAILDRHILNLMLEHHMLETKPKSLTKANYLNIEKEFNGLAKEAGMSPAKLDLTMWYLKVGEVLK